MKPAKRRTTVLALGEEVCGKVKGFWSSWLVWSFY